jgi:hypothetical protein
VFLEPFSVKDVTINDDSQGGVERNQPQLARLVIWKIFHQYATETMAKAQTSPSGVVIVSGADPVFVGFRVSCRILLDVFLFITCMTDDRKAIAIEPEFLLNVI